MHEWGVYRAHTHVLMYTHVHMYTCGMYVWVVVHVYILHTYVKLLHVLFT
jgi:hypothetical protein